MEDSRIYLLLEEIAAEIKSIEKKNRDLYTSAIDVEDEAVSIKVQTESFTVLRRMRGLKAAMETFKSELERSGILKSGSGEVYISNEHGSIGAAESTVPPKPIIPEPVYNPQPEYKPTPETNEQGLMFDSAVSDVIPAFEPEEIADPLPQYIEEEIETVGDIINELSQSIDEINGETGDLDDDFADLIQVSLEGFEEEFEKEFKPQIENRPESRDEAVQEVIKIAEDAIETIEEVIETVESAIEAIEEENEIDVERNIEDALEKFGDFRTGVTSLGEKPAEIPQVSFEPVSEPQPRPEPELSVPEIQPVSDVSMPVAEDDDFSGFVMSVPEVGIYNNRTPAGFAMFGRRVDVRDWADMLVKVCEILILKNPYTVAQFDKYHDLNPNENSYFSYNRVDIKDMPRKLSNGLWIELNRSNDDVVMLCKKLLELCGYPRSDIEIEFTD